MDFKYELSEERLVAGGLLAVQDIICSDLDQPGLIKIAGLLGPTQYPPPAGGYCVGEIRRNTRPGGGITAHITGAYVEVIRPSRVSKDDS